MAWISACFQGDGRKTNLIMYGYESKDFKNHGEREEQSL